VVGKALSHRLYWNNGPHEVEGPLIPIKPITKGFTVQKTWAVFHVLFSFFSNTWQIPTGYHAPKKLKGGQTFSKK
jgi:hypothetical protein